MLIRLYLEKPDIEIIILENREDRRLITDQDRGLPWFSARELEEVLSKNPSTTTFKIIAKAKLMFPGRLSVDDEEIRLLYMRAGDD